MSDDPFRCICPLDPDDLVNGYPRAAEGCPAHRARYAAQQAARRAEHQARLAAGTEPRIRACVEAWPDCQPGTYDPRCCRFPKSCSCTAYDPEQVTEEYLEPAAGTEEG